MAEISDSGGGGKGKKRSKKASTKIDMTPMVDLGFLLITFFMLTTTFNKPKAMEVNMPDKTKDQKEAPIKASHAMTIILGEGDKVYWYQGVEDAETPPDVKVTDFSAEGIRKVVRQKNKEIGEKFVVVIKAMDTSKYKNMVDILDEMTITDTKRYAIVTITPEDLKLTSSL